MIKTEASENSERASCVFCNIIKKEIPAEIIFENENTIAFLEIKPSAPGHTMVIPKKHGESILDFEEKELGLIMASVKKVSEKISLALSPDSLTIGINHMEKRGVPHLHIHIIPRWENDKCGIMQTIVHNPPTETLEQICERIRGQ